MRSPYPLQNIREGDCSTGSNWNTSTLVPTAPHPPRLSLSSSAFSGCPFTSSQPVSPAEGDLECPSSSISIPTRRITGDVFLAKSIPAANPLPRFPDSPTLVASPYPGESHQLTLSTIPWTYRLLAVALTQLTNTVPTFVTSPYDLSFNWGTVISTARALHEKYEPIPDAVEGKRRSPGSEPTPFPRTTAYVIVFRSRRGLPLSPATSVRLGELDSLAHEEAAVSGGLLKYWFGSPNLVTGRNLATCLWVDHEHAVRGGGGPGHRKAMREAKSAYVEWEVERLRLVVEEGGERYWFEPW